MWKSPIVLDTRKPFFLRRSDDLSVTQQARGGVMVEAGDSQNIDGIRLSARLARIGDRQLLRCHCLPFWKKPAIGDRCCHQARNVFVSEWCKVPMCESQPLACFPGQPNNRSAHVKNMNFAGAI